MRHNHYDESRTIAADHHDKERDYWLNRFAGEITKTSFPYDNKKVAGEEPETTSRSVSFTLSGKLCQRLMELSNHFDPTLHMIFAANLALLLYKYTGNPDIIVGSPVLKQETEAEFINMVMALRNTIDHHMTGKELLMQVRQTIIEATENQNYPIETLVYKLNLPITPRDFPLFDAAVLLENIHDKSYLRDIPLNMLFCFQRRDPVVEGRLEYNPLFFYEGTANRIARHFVRLLEALVFHVDDRVQHIHMLPEQEKQLILFEWNNTKREINRKHCYHELFQEQVTETPDHTAVISQETPGETRCPVTLTYRKLNETSNQLAALLREQGISRDCLVALWCDRSIAMLTGILGVFKAGGAYIPIEIDLPWQRIISILADSQASFLLTTTPVSDIKELFSLLSARTSISHIVFLDKQPGVKSLQNLFITSKLASRLASDEMIYPGENMVLADENGEIPYPRYMAVVKQLGRLIDDNGLDRESPVGVLLTTPINTIIALLALKQNGIPFIMVDSGLQKEKKKQILQDSAAVIMISESQLLDEEDMLFWESPGLNYFILVDAYDIKKSKKETRLRKVWDFVAAESGDAVNDYRWSSSYTGQPFSLQEMQQYIDNFKEKLRPYLTPQTRVLEVGCGHGLMLFEIAPHVGYYLATDLTPVIIEKNQQRVQREGIANVELKALSASQVDTLPPEYEDFDLFVCSSVIHFFPNTLYLEEVIKNGIRLLKEEGVIYLDDILDLRKKSQLIRSRLDYKEQNPSAPVRMDWDDDLFVASDFFHYLQRKYPEIVHWECSKKQGSIENELTRFRYDVLIKIDKRKANRSHTPPRTPVKRVPGKTRYTLSDLERYPIGTAAISQLPVEEKPDPIASCTVNDITNTTGFLPENPDSVNKPLDLCYMIYTSGTTGKPKGVMIHHSGMLNHLDAKINDLGIHAGDVVAQTASAGFDISVWQFLAALLKGGTTCIIDRATVLDPEALLTILQKTKVTILESVPSLMAVFLDNIEQQENKELKHLRWMLSTGEALAVPLVKQWYQHFPGIKLLNAYGPTEASDDVTHYVVENAALPDQANVPIGKPLQNTHIYIVDKHLALCPVGVRGEICAAGMGIGRGYWKDQAKTTAAFVHNPFLEDIGDNDYAVMYRTGDIGYFREDGQVVCLGRMDQQVKIRGHRIELGEIESQFVRHPQVHDAVVLVVPDKSGNKNLCAYMVVEKSLGTAELKEYLSLELPDYMIPACFIPMEQIPLTPNGKVDRKALPEPRFDTFPEEYIAPRDRIEKKMAHIWSEVLHLEDHQPGIDLNFFDLGGHSLRATILAARIHKEFKVKVPLMEIFNTPTIRDLARYIKTASKDGHASIEPVEKKNYYPLSAIQRRLYLVHQLAPDSTGYNITHVMHLTGDINRERLENIFKKLVQRHESFRTSFHIIDHEPVQRIHDNAVFRIEFDCMSLNPGIDSNIQNLIRDFIRPFDLSRAPLLRVKLIKKTENQFIVMTDIHHIVFDGVSNDLLRQDFGAFYEGQEERLPRLPLHYKDYAHWQNCGPQREVMKQQETYWLKEFAGTLPVLELPLDYPRPSLQRFEGDEVEFDLGQENTLTLKEFARTHDVTLFMLLLAIYYILLAKLSGQEDIIVGTPVAGRRHSDLANIIGMFVNTLALRNKPASEKTFIQFLKELKSNTLKAFENQDYPFDELVNQVAVEKDVSRNPLFDAMFLLQNFELSDVEVTGLQLKNLQFDYMSTRFDLNMQAIESEDNLYFLFQYSNILFSRETIERFVHYFKKIALAAVENWDKKLYKIMKIPGDKKQGMLTQFGDDLENEFGE